MNKNHFTCRPEHSEGPDGPSKPMPMISTRATIYLFVKWVVALVFFLAMENVKADDIYNFYFQKSRPASLENAKAKTDSDEQNAQIKTKSETKEKQPRFKKWELNLGMGSINGYYFNKADMASGQLYPGSWSFSQQLYVIGGKYNFGRFFDSQASLLIPAGVYDQSSTTQYRYREGSALNVLLMLGVGTTPFHFDFLGFDFLDLGWDVSVLFGEEKFLGGNTSALIWGPRMALNFSKSFSLLASLQKEIKTHSPIGTYSIRLAYRW